MTESRCPSCGGVVERVNAEVERTMAPAFARSADDLYRLRVDVSALACTACEWCAEFTASDTIRRREAARR